MKSSKAIREQIAKLQVELVEAEKRERAELLAKFQEMAGQAGLTVSEIIGRANGKLNGRKVAVKYADPKSGKTWSGRGRKPLWLSGAKDASQFLA